MKVRKFASILLVLLLLLSLTACGGNSKAVDQEAAADMMYEAPAEMDTELTVSESGSTSSLPTDRKLIRTISIDAETEDLAALLESITARITELGGYVEAKNLRNGSNYGGYIRRSLSMTVRIPAEKADAFVENVSKKCQCGFLHGKYR